MNAQPDDEKIKSILKQYFDRLSILTTQVPTQVRELLLPGYMLHKKFKSIVYIDDNGKAGFEIRRERASRISIKVRRTRKQVEEEIFGISGINAAFVVNGRYTELWRLVFTHKNFTKRLGNQLPKDATILVLADEMVPIKVGNEAEVKVIDCEVHWILGKQRYVKYIPFAWIFGNISVLMEIDPVSHAESDFYFALFNSLYEIITDGYRRIADEKAKREAFEMYMKLITKIEEEVRSVIYITEADEQVFQNLLTRYKFFLWPGAESIESQPTLRGEIVRRPDFYIRTKEGKVIYVEIEPPAYKPFRGVRKSSRLREALNQVSDWKNILGDNKDVRYMIIIGLLEDLSEEEKSALEAFNEEQDNLVVVTWDYILGNIERVKAEVSKQFAGTASS
ncbi:Shedu anti-phage system protein SduA domain-containing protein [Thermococcus sp.]